VTSSATIPAHVPSKKSCVCSPATPQTLGRPSSQSIRGLSMAPGTMTATEAVSQAFCAALIAARGIGAYPNLHSVLPCAIPHQIPCWVGAQGEHHTPACSPLGFPSLRFPATTKKEGQRIRHCSSRRNRTRIEDFSFHEFADHEWRATSGAFLRCEIDCWTSVKGSWIVDALSLHVVMRSLRHAFSISARTTCIRARANMIVVQQRRRTHGLESSVFSTPSVFVLHT